MYKYAYHEELKKRIALEKEIEASKVAAPSVDEPARKRARVTS